MRFFAEIFRVYVIFYGASFGAIFRWIREANKSRIYQLRYQNHVCKEKLFFKDHQIISTNWFWLFISLSLNYIFYKVSKNAFVSILLGLIIGLLLFPTPDFSQSILVGILFPTNIFPTLISQFLLFWSFLFATIVPILAINLK